MICGKAEKDESFEEAAARETLEETGIGIEITELYKIFENIQISSGRRWTESFVAVFFGEVISGPAHHESPEVLEEENSRSYQETSLANSGNIMKT